MGILQNTIDIFESRKNDIVSYFEMMENIELIINSQQKSILRSTAILLFYNITEAVVVSLFKDYYDELGNVYYDELPANLQELWIDFRLSNNDPYSSNHQTYINTSKAIVNHVLNNNLVTIPEQNVKRIMSGNADYDVIKNLFRKHGIIIQDSRSTSVLKGIKTSRNDLGHGVKTFEEVGREKTLDDLSDEKDLVLAFLQELIDKVKEIVNANTIAS